MADLTVTAADVKYDISEGASALFCSLTVARSVGATIVASAIGDITRTVLMISFRGAGTCMIDKNIRPLLLSVA